MTQPFAGKSALVTAQGEALPKRRSLRRTATATARLLPASATTATLAPATANADARPSQPSASKAQLCALELPVLAVPADSRPHEVTVAYRDTKPSTRSATVQGPDRLLRPSNPTWLPRTYASSAATRRATAGRPSRWGLRPVPVHPDTPQR